uniref:Glycosyltransferase n=1 Tax=Panagrolaimus sp. JU765 TaxID=591449 RepID=A0AC34QZT1_9BILA
MREQLNKVFDHVTFVNIFDSKDSETLEFIGRPELGVTFTKLNCWKLTQYTKCVYIDSDALVIKNSDELFDRPEIAGAPDIGWPDNFNSGVFVFEPSNKTYRDLVQFALHHGSFDGADQGLLNEFFSEWRHQDGPHRLSFVYNTTSGVNNSYVAALRRYKDAIKIAHFLGAVKPWHNAEHHGHLDEHWARWRKIFNERVKPFIPPGTCELN